MNVNRDEAAASLKAISLADSKMKRLRGYSNAAPHLLIWGVVWLVANSLTDLKPEWTYAWAVCWALGLVGSFIAGWMTAVRKPREKAAVTGARYSWRFALVGVVAFFFFFCFFTINPVGTLRQGNALLSIFTPFAYMFAGIFGGWRLFAIGAVAAALIMLAWFFVQEHFYLWMGVCTGGTLILGGLWLRKA